MTTDTTVTNYLQRYRAGEYKAVWHELTSLGDEVRYGPVYTEALAVAKETMRRVRFNVERLHKRLSDIDYQFLEPEIACLCPDPDVESKLDELESITGPLPLSITMWYRMVGSVDFCGDHSLLSRYHGEGPVSNPLVVGSIDDLLTYHHAFRCNRREKDKIIIAPDIFHKGNYSGGGGQYIVLPNKGMDSVVQGLVYIATFVDYLRLSIFHGGFAEFAAIDLLTFEHDEDRRAFVDMRSSIAVPHHLIHGLTFDLLPF